MEATEAPALQGLEIRRLAASDTLNADLLDGFDRWRDDPATDKTHLIEGRWENIYVTREQVPSLKRLMRSALELAGDLLDIPAAELSAGFWFNEMGPGQTTSRHSHDDYDELLSGVYYVTVPDNSGRLVIEEAGEQRTVQPQAGLFAFFPPQAPHWVTRNLSNERRISIGMNFGLLKNKQED